MRTLDELEDALDRDLTWRRTELQALRSQVRGASLVAQAGLCRAGVALLYAHWEGYTRFALTAYLRFVAIRRLRYAEMHPAFVALGARHAVKASTGSASNVDRRRTEWVLTSAETRSRFSGKEEINTQSNLNSEVCSELLAGLGLSGESFQTKSHLIDYSLLRARNEIAHGQYSDISADTYSELHGEVMSLLESIRQIVWNAADAQAYRRRTS